jgi:predicted permease
MEAFRDQRGLRWLEDVGRDVSYGLRTLRRSPGFAATAMLSLALGIGATTGIFSLVDQVILRLLPVREPQRLVLLDWNGNSLSRAYGAFNLMSYPLCRDLQEQGELFDGAFCRSPAGVNFSTGQQHRLVNAEIVSGSYFSVLGVRPALGRLIDQSDDVRPGDHPVVVLSYNYWKNSLGGAKDVVGRQVLVNNNPMTVIGVAAAGFRGVDVGEAPAFWIPAMMTNQAILEFDGLLDRRAVFMQVFGRLKSGRTPEQTEAVLQPWFRAMLEADTRREGFPRATDEERRAFLASTIDVLPGAQGWSTLRRGLARPLWVLMAGTTLLLLLATLNVASLLLARGAERTGDVTTRMALGASRARITGQSVIEGLLIALGGGLLGLVAAPVVSQVLLFFLPENADLTPRMDGRVFLFAFLVSLVTGALCGVAPAVQAGRRSLATAVARRATGATGAVRLRKAIVIAQLAFTLVLLVGAGLFVQTLTRLQARDRGFDSGSLLMFRADPAGIGYPESEAPQVMRDLLRTLKDVPGVERAAVANNALLGAAGPRRTLTIKSDGGVVEANVPMMRVGPGFFSTLGTRLIAGREFEERDTVGLEETGVRSIIVNESFARRYFGRRSPVGDRVAIGDRSIEIVGMVADFSRRSLRDDPNPEHIFFPFDQTGPLAGDGTFYVKVRGKPESAFASIRAAVSRVSATLPLLGLTTLEDRIVRALRPERMLATLSSGFGAIALLLSAVGLYGVMSVVVTQRTQEIGVRLALGATRPAAVWLIVRDALIMIGAGTAIALPSAWALRRLVEAQLFGIGAFDGPTVAVASGVLAVVALGAATLPAWRAAVLPPMVAIRDQPESMWHAARLKVRRAIRDLAAGSQRSDAPSATLISEFTGLVRRAATFSEALHVALPALRERAGAQFIMLLEKVSSDEYRGEHCSIPARGVLVNRLTHYPHPLPLTPGDFEAWLRWAREFRPEHVPEIERLKNTGAGIAVALRTKREIVGVLLLGAPEGHEDFTGSEKQFLSSSAELFALMIENARLNDRVLEQEKVRRDLALAAEVQRRLLPPQPPSLEAVTLAAFTLPARSVGGDFYDFLDLPGGRIGIAVADIAGKGIAAALLTSVVQASLRVISAEGDIASSQLAARMNRFLYRSTAANHYATFFYAQLDGDGRRVRYVNAGHNPPYLVRRTEAGVEIADLSAGGTVLGLFPEVEYRDAEVDLRPGDLLVAFTDGVTEARNANGDEFGEERLKDLLRGAVGASAEEVSSLLAGQIREWIAGAEQHDDVTFVVATVN